MIILLRLLLFLTLQICALLCAGLRIHWRKKRVRVYELQRCKLLYSLSALCRIQAPRTPATCLLCWLRTIRNLSCSFMFKTCAFHSCSKYATPIFVALALEVLANLRLFHLVSLPRQIHHEFDIIICNSACLNVCSFWRMPGWVFLDLSRVFWDSREILNLMRFLF